MTTKTATSIGKYIIIETSIFVNTTTNGGKICEAFVEIINHIN